MPKDASLLSYCYETQLTTTRAKSDHHFIMAPQFPDVIGSVAGDATSAAVQATNVEKATKATEAVAAATVSLFP